MIAILDNINLTDEVLNFTICFVGQTLNARSRTALSYDPGDLSALTPNRFSLERENASTPFMPSIERYHDLRKSFKLGQAYAGMIWKRWNLEYLPRWNQRWSKEHMQNLKEGELFWLLDDSVKRCEYKLGWIVEIFTGNDGVSEIENRAGNVGTTSNQQQMPSDSKKKRLKLKKLRIRQNSKIVKTEIFGTEILYTSQFFEEKTWATGGYCTQLG